MDFDLLYDSLSKSIHASIKLCSISNVRSSGTLFDLSVSILNRKVLNHFVKQPRRIEMRAVVCVVSSLWVIYDPFGVISCMVKDDIDDTQHALISLVLKDCSQLGDSLNWSQSSWAFKIVVINSCLSSERVVAERFSILLNRSEMYSVIAKLLNIV